jgi:hypothetical protein
MDGGISHWKLHICHPFAMNEEALTIETIYVTLLQWMVALAIETIYLMDCGIRQWNYISHPFAMVGGISHWNYICHPFAMDGALANETIYVTLLQWMGH